MRYSPLTFAVPRNFFALFLRSLRNFLFPRLIGSAIPNCGRGKRKHGQQSLPGRTKSGLSAAFGRGGKYHCGT